MVKITGGDKHIARLRAMRGPRAVRAVTQALFAGAQDIANDAAISITTGAVSGKNHVASAPGEPPNADTNVLSGSIQGVSTGPLKAETEATAPYAAAHELGSESQGLPERPYLRPAADRQRPRVLKRVQEAVNGVIRASG